LVTANLGRALVLASVPLAAAFSALHMRQLHIVTALTGILTVLFDVAYQSYLPSLVERQRALEGNSKLALSSSMGESAGPGLTEVLVELIAAPMAILVDALSFRWSAMMVWLIRKPEPIPAPHASRTSGTSWLRSAGCGWATGTARDRQTHRYRQFLHWFLSEPLRRRRDPRSSDQPAVLGVVIAVGGAANMLGMLIGSMLLVGVAALMVPLAHRSVLMATAFLVAAQLGDVGWPIYDINELTLRQAITPKDCWAG
jgi:hypothetical protein